MIATNNYWVFILYISKV